MRISTKPGDRGYVDDPQNWHVTFNRTHVFSALVISADEELGRLVVAGGEVHHGVVRINRIHDLAPKWLTRGAATFVVERWR